MNKYHLIDRQTKEEFIIEANELNFTNQLFVFHIDGYLQSAYPTYNFYIKKIEYKSKGGPAF